MDWAAEQKSLDIQYCLTLPRFVLFSAELDSVSHARGSPDYAYNFLQWNIGFQSLWAEAAGLAVLKDTFHSVHVQPEVEADGDVPGDIFNEHFSDLHAAVSTFSSGKSLVIFLNARYFNFYMICSPVLHNITRLKSGFISFSTIEAGMVWY